MSEQPPEANEPPEPYRLDPDRAAAEAAAAPRQADEPESPGLAGPAKPEPAFDPRPYRWAIGIFGLVLLIGFSVYMFTTRGIQSAGIAPGRKLHYFVAPLATSDLNGDANLNPRCDPAHPNPRALNVCGRTPIVLGLFATGSSDCKRQIDTIQTVSHQFSSRAVAFAAVAVNTSHGDAEKLVRSHGWTIPVAYDADGAVGAMYNVSICPMVELARRGGVVASRLIGDHWLAPSALAAQVRTLLAAKP
ncbi:MAG TPA: redoxin domain-containing protein [Solirubrobacteraceae bacterium]